MAERRYPDAVPEPADLERHYVEQPLAELFENRDYRGSTHFFFDVGNGNYLAYFDFPGLDLGGYAEVLGGLHHIAISVTPQQFDRLVAKVRDAGIDDGLLEPSAGAHDEQDAGDGHRAGRAERFCRCGSCRPACRRGPLGRNAVAPPPAAAGQCGLCHARGAGRLCDEHARERDRAAGVCAARPARAGARDQRAARRRRRDDVFRQDVGVAVATFDGFGLRRFSVAAPL